MDNQNHISRMEIDAKIYKEATSGTLLEKVFVTSPACLNFRTPKGGNNVLHIACKHNHTKIIKYARYNEGGLSSLFFNTNSVNETPFHTAVRYGHTDTVELLVEYFNSITITQQQMVVEEGHGGDRNKPWWIKNSLDGDTVLHVSIRNGYQDIAIYLLKEADPKLATCVNKVGESPLYLAAENRSNDVLKEILLPGVAVNYSVSGPNGRNPLHAAVKAASIPACTDLIEQRPEFTEQQDIKGKTPLHLAVDYEQKEVLEKLLKKDPATATVPDKGHLTPLLRAATKGYYKIVKTIITLSPQSTTIANDKNKRNVIHAVNNMSCHNMRKFLKLKDVKSMINNQDSDGNTPLHLSIITGNRDKAITLLEVQSTDWKIKNNNNQTPMDLLTELEKAANLKSAIQKALSDKDTLKKEAFIMAALEKALATGKPSNHNQEETTLQLAETKGKAKQDPSSSSPSSSSSLPEQPLHRNDSAANQDQNSENDELTRMQMRLIRHAIKMREAVLHPLALKSMWGPSFERKNLQRETLARRKPEDLKKIMDGVTLVATLVVTLTFAAAFTVPGGYDQNTGSIFLIKKPSLKVFFYSDTIAMLLCILIMLDYAWAFTTIRSQDLGNKVYRQTLALSVALVCTIIAFISGLYAVVPRTHIWLMHTISAVTFAVMFVLAFFHPINLIFLQFPINLSFIRLPIIFIGPLTHVGVTAFYDFWRQKAVISEHSSKTKSH